MSSDLSLFLTNNDCIKADNKKYCYQLTLMRLIQVTAQLDTANANNWAAKRTIGQLVENIDVVIDGLATDQKTLSLDATKAVLAKVTTAADTVSFPGLPIPTASAFTSSVSDAVTSRELPTVQSADAPPPQ